jgi:hypothetical protein
VRALDNNVVKVFEYPSLSRNHKAKVSGGRAVQGPEVAAVDRDWAWCVSALGESTKRNRRRRRRSCIGSGRQVNYYLLSIVTLMCGPWIVPGCAVDQIVASWHDSNTKETHYAADCRYARKRPRSVVGQDLAERIEGAEQVLTSVGSDSFTP